MTYREKVFQWQCLADVGKRGATVKYHAEIVKILLATWANPDQSAAGITESEVAAFVVRVAHYSASRFNAIVAAMKHVTPAAHILKRRAVRIKDRAMISQGEFTRLLAELDTRPQSHAGLLVRFLAFTGLRIKEARKLKWCDVHLDHILLPGNVAKSGKPRHIPFVAGITEILQRLRAVSDGVFVLPQGEAKRSLQTACSLAGVRRLSHHDFRHLFATRCIESGVDMPTVARWLGHQDGGALLCKVYFHLADRHSREMALRVQI